MPVFIDPRTGETFANVPDEDAERARREFGFVTPEEYRHKQDVEKAGEETSFGEAVTLGAKTGLGAVQGMIEDATGFGTEPGLAEDPGGGAFPEAYTPESRLKREARPIATGIGQGLAVAPLALAAGAGAGAVAGGLGAGAAIGTAASVLGEAAVEGVVQEYDDAWLEQRPMAVQNVAVNTVLFTGLDFAFRGALKGLGMALGKKPTSAIGGRNVVSEAQGAARELVDPVGARSVGAASADDLAEPFDDAIKQMSDRDAAVLARDADDHLHLIGQDASESFTRLNNGLSDNLGSQLKYEDFATYAAEFEPKMLERQAEWFTTIGEGAEDAARQISEGPYNFGNLGAKASHLISTFTKRIGEETDAGRRLVIGDEFKKRLDSLTMSIDGSFGVDNVTRSELKAFIEPTREALRKGLQNPKLFGGAADLQRSLNDPWHHLLESWRKVQNTLTEATGHVQFDVGGAGRVTRESTVDRMLAIMGKDPRSNQEFGRHLARTLEGVQGLIDARQAHGISKLDGLDEMAGDIRNLMEDWNLASTVGVAKNRVANMKKDPRKWGTLALDVAERLPIVGQPIKVGRTLNDAFTDLHMQQGTPLARVWDSAYKRYALNPAYQDPSVIRNYADWIQESLLNRGGKVTPPTGSATGAGGIPGVPNMAPANQVERGVASPAVARAQARESQSGRVVIGERAPVAKNLSKDEIAAVDSFATDYRAAGMLEQGMPDEQILAQLPEYTSEGLAELRQRMPTLKAAWRKLSVWNPTSDKPLVKGMSLTDSEIQSLVSKGEWSSPNSTYATWDPSVARKFAGRNVSQGKRPVLLVYDGVPTAVPSVGGVKKYDTLSNAERLGEEMIIPRGITFKVSLGPVEDGVQTIHLRGPAEGEAGYVNFSGRTGSNFSLGDVAKSPMGLVTGAGGVGLAINAAVKARAEEKATPPAHAYRDALKEIDTAGAQVVKSLATEALRKKPPKGKDRDPLALFAGKRKIQDAVEEARERLDEIAADPTTLIEQMAGSAGELGRTHPSVYMALTERAAKVAGYLQSVVPQRTATTLLDPVGSPPSFDRSWDFAARFVGATQPRVALREVMRGSAPPEMLEAVQQNWPELWDGFRIEMLGQVQRMHAAGRHMPSEKLRRLDSLLGMGGQLDPSASLEVSQHMLAAQDADAAKRQQQSGQQGGGAAPSGGAARASLSTPLAAIASGRQIA
jgi:hypothetical protein